MSGWAAGLSAALRHLAASENDLKAWCRCWWEGHPGCCSTWDGPAEEKGSKGGETSERTFSQLHQLGWCLQDPSGPGQLQATRAPTLEDHDPHFPSSSSRVHPDRFRDVCLGPSCPSSSKGYTHRASTWNCTLKPSSLPCVRAYPLPEDKKSTPWLGRWHTSVCAMLHRDRARG